jgi:putative membrane protein
MGQLIESQGALERIVLTPIPYAYVVHVHHILTIYLLSLPWSLLYDFGWYYIPAIQFIAFALLGIEQAGIEMEDPFGSRYNRIANKF